MKIILDENDSRAKVVEALAYASIVIANNADECKKSSLDLSKPEYYRDIEQGFAKDMIEYKNTIDNLLNNI